MVEDNEIKAVTSPFAIREGEIKVFDGKDGYVSMNQIIQRINLGHINDLHFKVLSLVNEFEFITSRQLFQLLEINGFEIKSQDKLNGKLDQLGKYLLNSRGEECKWQPTDNTKPVAMIKKRLAGNQVIIAYLRKVKAFDSYTPKPSITAKMAGKTFKATGGAIKLTKNDKSIDFVFEVVRREDDWQKKLIDKMKFYKDFYDNFVPMDSGFRSLPQLIIVCEDDKHMAETFKTIVMNDLLIDKIKLYFTTDLKQNDENLDESLTEFVLNEETGKYKIKNTKIKLLD